MRFLLVFLLLGKALALTAQINYTFVSDEEKVYTFYAADDTTVGLNDEYHYGEWIIFFDKTKKHKAAHFNFSDSTDWDTTWYINGQVHSIQKLTGQFCYNCHCLYTWYFNGQVREQSTCNADSCVTYRYHRNGQAQEISKSVKTPSSGKFMKLYYQMYWYSNGQPQRDFIDSSTRRQPLRAYYSNGQLSASTTWQNGCHVGPYTSYYQNGQPWIVGQYAYHPEDGKRYSNVNIGTWSYYKENGDLEKQEIYDEKGWMKRRLHYENGKLKKEVIIENGAVVNTIEY